MDSGRLQPALVGGLFIGVLSALPLVNAGNCCCCLWVIAGGVLAAYLRQQNSPYAVTSAEGAFVGFLAGLVGGVLGALLSIPVEMAMGPFQHRILDWVTTMNPDFPSELREMSERGIGPAAIAFKLVVGVVTGAVFGMIGGLLGVALFTKNKPAPPAVPGRVDVLPPE
jgi:hypothetical protein